MAEVSVRFFLPQVMTRDFEQRYLIDDHESPEPGYFASDSVLPQVLRPGFRHRLADRRSAPKPVRISLDASGYRNLDRSDSARVVFVGDSVVFGFGVDDEETLTAQMGRTLGANVANLGIPNAGPAEYMVMLQRYLAAGADPTLALVGLYTGNDLQNLGDSSWDELGRCELPAGRVRRRDVVPRGVARPAWLLTSGLGASHLLTALTGINPRHESLTSAETVQLVRLLGERAVGEIKGGWPTPEELQDSAKMAALYSSQLGESECVLPDERRELALSAERRSAGDWQTAYPASLTLGRRLAERGCAPVDKVNMIGVMASYNSYAGYYWAELERKSTGNIQLYSRLLASLTRDPAWSSFNDAFSRVRAKLAARDRTVEAEAKALAVQLQNQIGEGMVAPPAECDPLGLVLRRMDTLVSERGGHLLVVVLPAEYQLKGFAKDPGVDPCERMASLGIACFNTTPRFTDLYRGAEKSFYVDTSHFNRDGTARAVGWIVDWLQENRPDWMRTLN